MGWEGLCSASFNPHSLARAPPAHLRVPACTCAAAEPTGAARRRRATSRGWRRRRRSPPPPLAAAGLAGWPEGCADAELPAEGEKLLLDLVLLGASPQVVWSAIFGSAGSGSHVAPARQQQQQQSPPSGGTPEHGLLAHFVVAGLGCTHLDCTPWQPAAAGSSSRVLTYRTPLTPRQRLLLPLGPQAVANRDEQHTMAGTGGGLLVHCTCSTAGVPFADCFTNQLRWRLMHVHGSSGSSQPGAPAAAGLRRGGSGTGADGTRVLLTGRCCFHRPVPFPLKGSIERESLQTVRELYARFAPLLQQQLASRSGGGSEGGGAGSSPPTSNATGSSCMSVGGDVDATLQSEAGTAAEAAAAAAAAAAAQGHAPLAVQQLEGADDGADTWRAAKARVTQGMTAHTADGLLQQVEQLWPVWAAGGCRLPHGRAPSPDEAAVALRVVAFQCQRHELLARHRVVVGLVEALRLVPPRSSRSSRGGGGGGSGLGSSAGMAAALWGMSLLGRGLYWQEETEALCALLHTRPFASLKRLARATEALGRMRHHTAQLPLLERQAVALAAAATAAEQEAAARGDESERMPQNRLSLPAVADIVWGLAQLGHPPTLLLNELPLALASWQRATAAQGTSLVALSTTIKLAWALAAAGCLHHPATEAVATAVAAAAARVPAAAKLSKVPLRQLHQFSLALQAEVQQGEAECGGGSSGGNGAAPSAGGSAAAALRTLQDAPAVAALLPAAAQAWAAPAKPIVSACQADVAAAARGLGLAVVEEHAVVPGLLVDIAVPRQRLAIEVDGPLHYCRNLVGGELRPLGPTRLKHRLVRAQGWALVSMPVAAWEALRGAQAKRAALRAAVDAALAEVQAVGS